MYRIVFNPKAAAWEIQLMKFWFFWFTVNTNSFRDFQSAQDYIEKVGLNQVYRNYHESVRAQVWQGGLQQC